MSRDAATSRCWSDCGLARRERGRVSGEVGEAAVVEVLVVVEGRV